MLTANEAQTKFDCWDLKKCPRRRWDAKNKASRNKCHVRNYRKQSVKAHIEKVGSEALFCAAKFTDVATILERDAALLFDPTEAFYPEVEWAIAVLREASKRLTLGKAFVETNGTCALSEAARQLFHGNLSQALIAAIFADAKIQMKQEYFYGTVLLESKTTTT